MQQAVLQHFPKTNVTYKFTNRATEMLFSRECFELAKQSIKRERLLTRSHCYNLTLLSIRLRPRRASTSATRSRMAQSQLSVFY